MQGYMDVVVRTLVGFTILLFLTRVMGKKQDASLKSSKISMNILTPLW